MNIAQGLKLKNRLVGKLAKLEKDIITGNQYTSESPKTFDSLEGLSTLFDLREELAILKAKILKANAGIANKLVTLAEAKATFAFLVNLEMYSSVAEHRSVSHYGEREIESYSFSQVPLGKVRELQKITQESIEVLQDEIDEYNATTQI